MISHYNKPTVKYSGDVELFIEEQDIDLYDSSNLIINYLKTFVD